MLLWAPLSEKLLGGLLSSWLMDSWDVDWSAYTAERGSWKLVAGSWQFACSSFVSWVWEGFLSSWECWLVASTQALLFFHCSGFVWPACWLNEGVSSAIAVDLCMLCPATCWLLYPPESPVWTAAVSSREFNSVVQLVLPASVEGCKHTERPFFPLKWTVVF